MTKSRILRHLGHEACPTCGAGIKAEVRQERTHVNGQQFESILFFCGCEVKWVPNFEHEEVCSKCPRSSESIARKARQAAVANSIRLAVQGVLNDKEKEDLDSFIRYELFK